MKHVREVCLIAFTLAKGITPSVAAQTIAACCGRSAWCLNSRAVLMAKAGRILLANPRTDLTCLSSPGRTLRVAPDLSAVAPKNFFSSAGQFGASPTLRQGITVELPVTTNAVPVAKADQEDSLIVTITYDGKVYFGIDPTSTTELTEKVKSALLNRADKTLYVKADARTAYRNLVIILDSVGTSGVERLTLLTAQRDGEEPGALVPPKGLEMSMVAPHAVVRNSSGSR
ncbi:MAG TPA: biopolymer transporter ExbD [Terriglobales bacterium]|nr:biopolymer transporter ExbD [Terriglobales bacterium]